MKHIFYFSLLSISLSFLFSCNYTQKINDGKISYDLKRYAEAAPLLEKEYRKTKDLKAKAKLAYYVAESYDKMNNSDKALEWYRKAMDDGMGVKAMEKYAYALKRAEMYSEAMGYFSDLSGEVEDSYAMRKEAEACKLAMGWKKNKNDNPYKVDVADFNSNVADYSPTLYKKDFLVISSDRPNSSGDKEFQWTGNDFSDLFIVDKNNGSVEVFPSPINSDFNEGTVAFNSDFNVMIFSRCGTGGEKDDYCKLMKSEFDGEKWSKPEVLSFVVDRVNYSHPAWDKERKFLYFASDEPDGWGGFDIYKVKFAHGLWDEPRILSGNINTEKDEMFPTFDGDTLYFSSEGRGGMGGLDIYKTYEKSPGKWMTPENLKAPINSGEDDFGFIVAEKMDGDILEKGYFTSARKGGKGGDDIYTYELKKTEPEIKPEPVDTALVVIPDPEPIPEPEKDIFLEVYVYGKTYVNPNDPKSGVTGKMALLNAGLQINSAIINDKVKTDAQGMYRFKIERGVDYRFFATSNDYFNKSAIFNTSNREEKEVYKLEILLEKIFRNVEINLDNIYYDFDKWNIRDDAKPTLNKLANILLQNPDIKIILGSHTDCRGKDAYNLELSQKRAQSAVDYLSTLGVEKSRLSASGYGETVPANACKCNNCSDDEHQENRRTTFRVLD